MLCTQNACRIADSLHSSISTASLAIQYNVLEALPGKLDIKDTHLVISICPVSKLIENVYALITVPVVISSQAIIRQPRLDFP